MKKYINKILALCTIAALSASCTDDAELTTLSEVSFGSIEATPGTIALNADNKYQSVLTVSWHDVTFPVNAPVTYALEFDVAADTIGNNAWANATRIEVGEAVLSKSFIGADLNAMAMDLGLPQDIEGQLVVRALATLDRTVYSNTVVINVTPFVQVITITQLYMPGTYQGWDPATAATLPAIDAGVFQGYITFPAGSLEFKFTTTPSWEEFYGPDGNGGLAEGADGNLVAPAAGSYQVTVNLNTNSYTLTPYDFGTIGTATAGGWDADTDMAYDYINHYWTWTGPLVPGALKFRLNDSWTINYGADANGTVMHLDNQGAHNVTEAGTYTVTFAVDPNPATATYSVTKID